MRLEGFGGILSQAAKWEKEDQLFFENSAKQSAKHQDLFAGFANDCKKNEQAVLRARRENVTEMILEAVENFDTDDYQVEPGDPAEMTEAQRLESAGRLTDRAVRFYLDAAEKIKAQKEPARTLTQLAKKRSTHRKKLESV